MSNIKFTIPEPCHENWQNMTATEQGRFCLSCQKEVIDFSKMDDKEVHTIMMQGDGNTCGRFSPEQMKTGINYAIEKKSYWHKYFFSFLLPAFLFTKQSNAQTGKIVRQQRISNPVRMSRLIIPMSDKSFEVSGKVVDSATNEIIRDATVTIDGTGNGTLVNDDGSFNLKGKVSGSAITLKITAIGYAPVQTEIAIPADGFIMGAETFYLKQQSIVLEAVTMHSDQFYGIAGGMRMIVTTSRFSDLPKRVLTSMTDSIKMFPNPVTRGNNFNISLKLKQAGTHTIQIIDLAGRVVFQQSVSAAGKQYNGQLNCNDTWPAGIYNIRVINRDSRITSISRFVVN